ncbi:MAG: hypothetical protein FJ242_01465 [Nitrospira sp.]|nr:hypothetical protein [Nitrospira sp.]
MKDIEFIKTLRKIGKSYYTIYDLEKITSLERDSLYVFLNRWVKKGILERITKGVYVLNEGTIPVEKIAAQLYVPSYLSFESALSKYGILTLIPYALTFATTKKTKKITLLNRLVEFRQIKKELFFGFELKDGVYIARPEKAFLDLVYMSTKGKTTLDLDELNLKPLSRNLILNYAKKFPAIVSENLKKLKI